MKQYYPGNPVYMEATFTNRQTGALENPETVTLYIKPNDGNDEDRITVAEIDLTNDSTGHFYYIHLIELDVSPRGLWCYGFYAEDSLGDPYASFEKHFYILDKCALP